jgi:hypothetical protein
VPEREPEMVALKMAADGMPIIPNVSSVMDEARGRGIAHLRYSTTRCHEI